MWDYLDETVPGYQDSLVLHMIYKPVMVGYEEDEDRYMYMYIHVHTVYMYLCTQD